MQILAKLSFAHGALSCVALFGAGCIESVVPDENDEPDSSVEIMPDGGGLICRHGSNNICPQGSGCDQPGARVCSGTGGSHVCMGGRWQSSPISEGCRPDIIIGPPDASTPDASIPVDAAICFSPTFYPELGRNPNGAGCPCKPSEPDVCFGGGFGIGCVDGSWKGFYDGVCGPEAQRCVSPLQNLQLAYTQGAVGCACSASDKDVCVGHVAFHCAGSKWGAVEDGVCSQPNPPRYLYTPAQCTALGGVALADPGDGSLMRAGCPGRSLLLGHISGYDEGGLCCQRKACGARAGNTCAADEYCAYEPGEYCGAADAEAICQPKPTACDANYDPVCGCNQKTYSNACQAAFAGTGVLERGACK